MIEDDGVVARVSRGGDGKKNRESEVVTVTVTVTATLRDVRGGFGEDGKRGGTGTARKGEEAGALSSL